MDRVGWSPIFAQFGPTLSPVSANSASPGVPSPPMSASFRASSPFMFDTFGVSPLSTQSGDLSSPAQLAEPVLGKGSSGMAPLVMLNQRPFAFTSVSGTHPERRSVISSSVKSASLHPWRQEVLLCFCRHRDQFTGELVPRPLRQSCRL